MKHLKYLLLVPCLLFPYVLLLSLACLFRGGMEIFFAGNILYLLAAMLGYLLITLVCTVTYTVLAIRHRWDAVATARASMIVKLAQIPAYVAIFVLGVLFLITIFTMGFSLFFVLYDGLSVLLSGLVGLVAVIRGRRECCGRRPIAFWAIMGVLQFWFCLDVVAAIVVYAQAKQTARGTTPEMGDG